MILLYISSNIVANRWIQFSTNDFGLIGIISINNILLLLLFNEFRLIDIIEYVRDKYDKRLKLITNRFYIVA